MYIYSILTMSKVMYIQDTLTGFFQKYKTTQTGGGRGLSNALRSPSRVISTGRLDKPITITPNEK